MKRQIGFRAINTDFTSSRGYRWPYPGKVATAPGPINPHNQSPCPMNVGDGLCIAKTWAGAASGGIPATTCLVVSWSPADLLGEDVDKVRVSKCRVEEVLDVALLMRSGFMAPTDGAADLRYADLRYADLRSADLRSADLAYADLHSANLDSANLAYADLASANLAYANLRYANLAYANLRSANLRSAIMSREWTVLPSGFVVPDSVCWVD